MVTAINYADQATLPIAGPHMARDLGLDPLQVEYMSAGGAVVDMDSPAADKKEGQHWSDVRHMLTSRMMLGVFFGQYFINSITWFSIYLVQDKGMSILKVAWWC